MTTYSIEGKVVHPCYGAGTIVRIQTTSIGAERHPYYVIDTVAKSMQLMVPVDRAESVGLRYVGQASRLREILTTCCVTPSEEELGRDLQTRQNTMREQLKSGSFRQVAIVVRTLFYMNNQRPLGTTDRQLFNRGKDLLASELALAAGTELGEAMQELEGHLASILENPESDA